MSGPSARQPARYETAWRTALHAGSHRPIGRTADGASVQSAGPFRGNCTRGVLRLPGLARYGCVAGGSRRLMLVSGMSLPAGCVEKMLARCGIAGFGRCATTWCLPDFRQAAACCAPGRGPNRSVQRCHVADRRRHGSRFSSAPNCGRPREDQAWLTAAISRHAIINEVGDLRWLTLARKPGH